MPPAGGDSASRSAAHLRWAMRYSKSQPNKAAVHLRRAIYYHGFGGTYESTVQHAFIMKHPVYGEIFFPFPSNAHTRVYNVLFYHDLVAAGATQMHKFKHDETPLGYAGEKDRGSILITKAGAPAVLTSQQMPAATALTYEQALAAYSSFIILVGDERVAFSERSTAAEFERAARSAGAMLADAEARTDAEAKLQQSPRPVAGAPVAVVAPQPTRSSVLRSALTATRGRGAQAPTAMNHCKAMHRLNFSKADLEDAAFSSELSAMLSELGPTTDVAVNALSLLDHVGHVLYGNTEFATIGSGRDSGSQPARMDDLLRPLVRILLVWLAANQTETSASGDGPCLTALFMFRIAQALAFFREEERARLLVLGMSNNGATQISADDGLDRLGIERPDVGLFMMHMKLANARKYAPSIIKDITTAAHSIRDIYDDYEDEASATVTASQPSDSNMRRRKAANVLGLHTTEPTHEELCRVRKKMLLAFHPDKRAGSQVANDEFAEKNKQFTDALLVFDPTYKQTFGA